MLPLTVLLTGSFADADCQLAVFLWLCHFGRRAAEAQVVHQYGQPSVPTADTALELAYYWAFAAWIGHAFATGADRLQGPPWVSALGLVLFAWAEWGNNRVHRLLAKIRRGKANPARRAVPHGPAFALVSCPHYGFEILSWVAFNVACGATAAGAAFAALGAAILTFYALRKHAAYKKEFKTGVPSERKAIIPYVL